VAFVIGSSPAVFPTVRRWPAGLPLAAVVVAPAVMLFAMTPTIYAGLEDPEGVHGLYHLGLVALGVLTGLGAAPAAGPGKDLFSQSCGGCHTLGAAGTKGTVGPNLDQLRPDAKTVLAAIRNGGTGSGAMPAGIVTGRQAQHVADFVAATAGR